MRHRNASSRVRSPLALALFLAFTAGAPRAEATTVRPITLEELTQRADLVVLATPRTAHSFWNGARIDTDHELEVQLVLRGAPATGALRVRTPGGVVDRVGQFIPGVPRLDVGRSYVLFLSQSREPSGVHYLAHLTAAVLRVTLAPGDGSAGVVVLPPAEGLRPTQPPHVPLPMGPAGVPLETFVRALRSAP